MYLTSAWHDDNIVTITSYRNNVGQVGSMVVPVTTSGPVFIEFGVDFQSVDMVTFHSSNWQFVMDDFKYILTV